MFFIVWGFRARYRTVGGGTFYCPKEGGDRVYRTQEVRKWFTFFWIPVIPLAVLGEFVECTGCGSSYDDAVLTMPTAAVMMDNLANAMRHAVVSIINADGVIVEAEKRVALDVMKQFSDTPYTEQDLDHDLASLQPHRLSEQMRDVAGMLNDRGKERLLVACMLIAGADGSIDETELEEVTRAGLALGMSPAHIRGIISEASRTHLDR